MSAEKQRTILLVDDEAIIAMAEKMTLKKYGYDVITALTGEEAIETIEKTPGIDLILMDIDLGAGMDGTKAAAIILGQRDLPVVFLSSHMEPEVVAKTEKITSYGYIAKSSSITVLDASIKMAFKLFEAKIKEIKKEKVLQDIIDKNPLSIQIVDTEGFTLRTNPAHTLLFGAVPPADFSIFNDMQLKQQGFGGLIERIKEGEVVQFPIIRYNAHDSVPDAPDVPVWVRTVVFPINDSSGKPENFVFMHENITESKEAEAALRQSEDRFRAIIAHTPDHIIIHDRDLRYTFVANPQLGLTEADMLGKTDHDILEKGEAKNLIAIKQKVLDTGVPFYLQTSLQNLRGGKEYFEGAFIPKFDSAGKPDGLIGYFRNVTQRKLAEAQTEAVLETLRKNEKELQYLFKSMITAFVLFESIFDEKGDFISYRFVYINDAYEHITGVKNEEVKGKSVHEVWPETEAEWIKRYGEVAVTGVSSEFELYHDPTKKLYHCNVYRPWNNKSRFCVVFEDITERKQAEATLRGSEERYKALFDRSLDLIYIHDFEGRFIDANDAALNRLGYSREEIRGLNFASLLGEDQLPLALKTMQEIRETGFQKDLTEFRLRHKNGGTVYVETQGSAILSKGSFSAIQSIARDISERKQSAGLLARQNDALLKLNQFSIELSMLSAEDDLEALIAKRIKEIAGAELAVFSEYDPENRTTTIRHIEMEPGLLKQVVGLLGKQVEKIHSTVSTEMYREMTKEKIIGSRKTLHEMSFGAISRPVGAAIQALLKVDRFIGIAYLVEGNLYGTSVLGMNKDQPDPSQPILENFSYLASMALRRKRAESQREAALEKLRSFALAVESSSDAIGMSTPAGKHYYQNKAFTDLFGDIGENPPATVYVDEQVGRKVFRTIMGGNPWAGEIKMKGKAGELLDVFQRAYAIKDSAGRILSLVGIHTNINERKRAEEEIKQQLAEKVILLKEVHHRIKNNIASIGSLISLRLQSITNPEAVAVLQDAIGRVDSMRILYDKLLLTEDYKDISVKNYIESLTDAIVVLFPGSVKVTFEKHIADFHLDPKLLFPLGIIINELLTNKIKYAFINRDAGRIQISLTHIGHQVTLIIQDNGVELPDGFDIKESKGFGLMLVNMLSQQLGGSFAMEKGAGTCCTVEFDI